ncbi:MAG TPA: 3-phosphoshikimate 1-carboxyvinyltransferase [Leptospiraceae bacterium]|nr:3-phosphoshikimate 1-carboxyvinyltransferase [Spirochaetaceae bacterium]HBS05637.1 3-phosphoshikimate 1-carboxyvinyltransferase [Leptospiraceae bacterium]
MAEASNGFFSAYVDSWDVLQIPRIGGFSGTVELPGSKSIANRALLLAALGTNPDRSCILKRLPDSDDVNVLRNILPALGVSVVAEEQGVRIQADHHRLSASSGEFYVENAGTAMRPLLAVLSALKGSYLIYGNEQMNRRPIGDLAKSLQSLGVEIEASEGGCPPVRVSSDGWKSQEATIQGRTSSQFVSAMLMAAPLSEKEFVLRLEDDPVSKPYIDLTITMMKDFGVQVLRKDYQEFIIPGNQRYLAPEQYEIEGDASAATYFLAAGALPGQGPVRVNGLGRSSIQGDQGFFRILESMGAMVKMGDKYLECSGGSELKALDLDMNAMPDAAMTLATLNLFADGKSSIRNVANLRVKESERIHGLKTELERTGASVEEGSDYLIIQPPSRMKSARFQTYLDHRMAMAFSLVSAGVSIEIEDPGCVRKTYPDYFLDFLKVAQK